VGKRVAVASNTQFGCYAEYSICEATTCFEIENDLALPQAACTFVNPLTVMAMLEITKSFKSPAVIHTAAASALGIESLTCRSYDGQVFPSEWCASHQCDPSGRINRNFEEGRSRHHPPLN
jgi:hypothetical protein